MIDWQTVQNVPNVNWDWLHPPTPTTLKRISGTANEWMDNNNTCVVRYDYSMFERHLVGASIFYSATVIKLWKKENNNKNTPLQIKILC